MTTALVFCGGGPVVAQLPPLDELFVIAADSGLYEASRLGFQVDLLVGDLDSVRARDIGWAEDGGSRVERHPIDKDASDLELALDAATRSSARRIVVAGGQGGRLDHLLGNMLLLAAARFADVEVDAVLGQAQLHVIHGRRELDGDPGELISLFALGGPARGVRTTGLRWTIDGDDLVPGSTLGLSNEIAESHASIEVSEGAVLAVRPGESA